MIETYNNLIQNLNIQFDLELVNKKDLLYSDFIETEMARLTYITSLVNKLIIEVDTMKDLSDEQWKQVHHYTALTATSCVLMSMNFIQYMRGNDDFKKVRNLKIKDWQKQIMIIITNLIGIGLDKDISMAGNVDGGIERN